MLHLCRTRRQGPDDRQCGGRGPRRHQVLCDILCGEPGSNLASSGDMKADTIIEKCTTVVCPVQVPLDLGWLVAPEEQVVVVLLVAGGVVLHPALLPVHLHNIITPQHSAR